MVKYEKTAKDRAFDRERVKLTRQICKLRAEVSARYRQIKELEALVKDRDAEIEKLRLTVLEMQDLIGLSDEQVKLLLSKEERNEELRRFAKNLKVMGGLF